MEPLEPFHRALTCDDAFHHPFQRWNLTYSKRTHNLPKTDTQIPPKFFCK